MERFEVEASIHRLENIVTNFSDQNGISSMQSIIQLEIRFSLVTIFLIITLKICFTPSSDI